MKSILAFHLALLGLIGWAATAAAQVPAAVVEDVKGKPPGVEFMDYVTVGQVIKLGPKDTIVLGYMKSCWRETITGGTVVIGAEQSMVHQGTIERDKIDCGGSRQQASSRHARESAATVFRSLAPTKSALSAPNAEPPEITIYALSPVIDMKGGGSLVIERLDRRDERHELTLRGNALVHGRFFDLVKVQKALAAGGTYVASAGDRKIVFKIAPDAKPGPAPIIARLLIFD